MGFKLMIDGADKVELGIEHILSVAFEMDTPHDSNARSTDVGTTLVIKGKILTAIGGEAADSTLNIAKWSIVPAESADSYRNLSIAVVSADQVVRQINFPNAFVIDYKEEFGNTEGIGEFTLKVKQKKDKIANVKLEGGYGI